MISAVRIAKLNWLRKLLTVVVLTICGTALAASATTQYRAPGWGDLPYDPPAAGTYDLPVILNAKDGEVLRSDGSSASLFELMSDRFVLLSFIFARCSDINGCPLANAVLYKVQSRLNQQPEFAKEISLLSISFDPEYDTTTVTKALKNQYHDGIVEWEFLTTSGQDALQPILDGYGQFAVKIHDEHGHATADYAHLLRVYLIDRKRQVRNIYSVSFLHPDILLNDLETLLLEANSN